MHDMIRKFIKKCKEIDDAYVIARETGLTIRSSLRISLNSNTRKAYIYLRNIPCKRNGIIVDAGASRGKFTKNAIIRFTPERIICIEPLPIPFKEIFAEFHNDEKVELINCALGATDTTSTLKVIGHDEASSILPIKNIGITKFRRDDLVQVDEVEVEVKTLDKIAADHNIEGIDLLKIDVQGYELEVLKGAAEILSTTKCIKLEVSFYELYEKGVLFDEIHEFFKTNNFYLYCLEEYLRGDNNFILQCDAIYLNADYQNKNN